MNTKPINNLITMTIDLPGPASHPSKNIKPFALTYFQSSSPKAKPPTARRLGEDRCSSTALNWLDLPTSLAFAPPKPYTSDLQAQAHPNPPQQRSKASGVKFVQRCGPWYAAGKGAGSLGSFPSSIPTTFPNIIVCGWVEACGDADVLQGPRILAGHATGQNGGNDAKRTQKEGELSKRPQGTV
ncbi:hypothetical protein BDP67DRAFT_571793 [Colletotrichum lupini]|nr:hypothetical protein BDP67DRAFT_571793 [Colletotrichum lupini]